MAEALGVAASVAGVLGLCGQILQGSLFLKDFIEGARDAPEDIRLLLMEVQILSAAAGETKEMIEQMSDLEFDFKVDTYEPALKQCHELLSTVVRRITANSAKMNCAGRMKWWYQLNVSAQRKTLDSMMHRLERAKTQVQMVQSNICLTLLRNHYLLSRSANRVGGASQSDVSAAMILDRINYFEGTIVSLTSSVIPTASESLEKISRVEAHLRCLEKLAGGCNLISDPISHVQRTSEWSKLHHLIRDAVSTALEDHIQHPEIQLYHEALATCSKKDAAIIEEPQQDVLESLRSNFGATSTKLKPHLFARSRVSNRAIYRNPFIDVEIISPSSREIEDLSICNVADRIVQGRYFAVPESQPSTSIHIRLRLPFWHRGIVIGYSSSPYPYVSSIGLTLTTYNIRNECAPIFKAAEKLDLLVVRDLLRLGLASPRDRTDDGMSPLDFMMKGLMWPMRWSNLPDIARVKVGLELVELLSNSCPAEHRYDLHFFHCLPWMLQTMQSHIPEFRQLCCRSLPAYLHNLDRDPFSTFPVAHMLTYDLMETEVCQSILHQDIWPIELDKRQHYLCPDTHVESDRQMLLDPDGLKMEADIKSGKRYLAYPNDGWSSDVALWSASYSLMHMYATSSDRGVHACCLRRLELIYREGGDPRTVEQPNGSHYSRYANHADVALILGLESVLTQALTNAGWTIAKIEDLFDESLYSGLPDLFEGRITYLTQEEFCTSFMQSLCYSGPDLPYEIALKEWKLIRAEISRGTGMRRGIVENLMRNSYNSLQYLKTPGSWPGNDELVLVPGVDFALLAEPVKGTRYRHMAEWPCIQQVLAKGGYGLELFYDQSKLRVIDSRVWGLNGCVTANLRGYCGPIVADDIT